MLGMKNHFDISGSIETREGSGLYFGSRKDYFIFSYVMLIH